MKMIRAEFIKQIAGSCAKELLKTFLGFGLNNFIEMMVTNDTDKKEYILTFQTKEQFEKRFKEFERKDNVGVNLITWIRENWIVGTNDLWRRQKDMRDQRSDQNLYEEYLFSEEEESEKELEERTERNMILIDAFCEHLKGENIVIPESAILSFFNA